MALVQFSRLRCFDCGRRSLFLAECDVCIGFGRAKVTYPNGDTYEGAFNDERQKHGAGVYTWSLEEGSNPWLPEGGLPEGRVVKYEGSWVNGARSGVGKITYPNGDRYHGAFSLPLPCAPLLAMCCSS